METTILWGLIIVLAGIAATVGYITARNRLTRLHQNIDKAWANIDLLLKQRHDELPKLIETCKGYMQDEQKTLQGIVEARTAFPKAASIPQKAQANSLLSAALKTLFAVAERYPDLKTNNIFTQIRRRIAELEGQIADRREAYNNSVNIYNTRLHRLPELLVAKVMRLKPKEIFQVTE